MQSVNSSKAVGGNIVLDATLWRGYTERMSQSYRRILLLTVLLLASLLAACSPGHVGGNEIAFLRAGQLWTMDPDGANAFEIVANTPPVIGYGWSPTHQILTFRTLDPDYAKTAAAHSLTMNPLTQLLSDVPSSQNTIGIDGGSPIPILFSSKDVQLSNAWWNASGNRLFYREALTTSSQSSPTALWWISQNDQPGGIARKLFPSSFSIPSIASNNSVAIGNSFRGLYATALDGTNLHFIVPGKLAGHPLPAALERTLLQPAHNAPVILYAISTTGAGVGSFSAKPLSVQLVVADMHGHVTTLTTCTCSQFAWSPDGNSILYSSGTTYTLLHLSDRSSFSITADEGSIPYWSPDSQFLLLDGVHSLTLLTIASQHVATLLSDGTPASSSSASTLPNTSINALLQPMSNSVWSADSRHFLFLTRGRLFWEGKALTSGKGLYTIAIDDHGQPQGTPTLADAGNDTQAGWTYEDPTTSFLFP